ncbi:unnamed protein product [Cylindrotheca closterium]|uniref:Uncharacterized protein n=1 Tax=Cylindrotheca closterium TaxID=2856 RepID=A0AAD2JIQ2_9STRA|nr:unnamed protein product [Cylindrotheca closterium]
MASSDSMTSSSSDSIDTNGSPSRPQDVGSLLNATMTRRSPRSTRPDYDLLSGLPLQKVRSIEVFPPSPTLVRPASFSRPVKKRRRRSSLTHTTQHLLTLEKCLLLGWCVCFAVGYLVFFQWRSGDAVGPVPGGSNSSIPLDRSPTPEHYIRSRSPLTMGPPAKLLKSEPLRDQSKTSDMPAEKSLKEATASDEELASNSEGVEDEDENGEDPLLVHIIHSRFMQHQPHLVELGLARLALMKEFFLPSLSAQSSQNFLCVIRIDPELNTEVKSALFEALETLGGNFTYLVIASNDNPHSEYWNINKHQANLGAKNIVGGNYTSAKEYMMKTRNILETRLDVDDGLNQFFVEELQDQASEHFDSYYSKQKSNSPWKVWCSSTHFEWQFQPSEMWEVKQDDPQTAPPNVTGTLLSIRSTICITAGLSVAYVAPDPAASGVQTLDLPSTQKHTAIHRNLPKCGSKQAKDKHHSGGCVDFFNLVPTAIRARSPTSAGMYNILWPHHTHENFTEEPPKLQDRYLKEAKRQAIDQAKFWKASEYYFDFGESSASRVHAYLSDHMKEIAEENLVGQCTHGHSCKNSSRLVLESILKEY